jgi:hypothetical protein
MVALLVDLVGAHATLVVNFLVTNFSSHVVVSLTFILMLD